MGNLIVFGAGASYGSESDDTKRPPLDKGLFSRLCKFKQGEWGDTWGALSPYGGSTTDHEIDFESRMKAFAAAKPSCVRRLQRAMADFFFQFTPTKETSLYVRLAKLIGECKWSGALASLNYERLLELSLREVGLNVVLGGTDDHAYELCLPHGCCHLFCNVRTESTADPGDRRAANVVAPQRTTVEAAKGAGVTTIRSQNGRKVDPDPNVLFNSEGIRVIENPDEHAREVRGSTVSPVMCNIDPDKKTMSGMSFIKCERRRFAELVLAADRIAIIGLKVRPLDAHIWCPLRCTRAKIMYCAGKEAGEEFCGWSRGAGRDGDRPLPGYWQEHFGALCSWVGIHVGQTH